MLCVFERVGFAVVWACVAALVEWGTCELGLWSELADAGFVASAVRAGWASAGVVWFWRGLLGCFWRLFVRFGGFTMVSAYSGCWVGGLGLGGGGGGLSGLSFSRGRRAFIWCCWRWGRGVSCFWVVVAFALVGGGVGLRLEWVVAAVVVVELSGRVCDCV